MKDTPSGRKPKLAIISTFDELCGIAGYTRALVSYLGDDFDIEVFDLDQYLLRAQGGNLLRLGDQQIKEICERIKDFDAVNLQLEYGTLGATPPVILRRLQMIANAAPALSVTFHTILQPKPFPSEEFRIRFFKLEIWNCYAIVQDWRMAKRFRAAVYHTLRETQKVKPVSIIVHTPRDARAMKLAERFTHVFDHPLAFLSAQKVAQLKSSGTRAQFPRLAALEEQDKVIGVFGFLSEYKGIHTAIRALSFLPPTTHLAIFGALHPGEIRPPSHGNPPEMNPYIARLLGESHADETLIEAMGGNGAISVELGEGLAADDRMALVRSPRDLSGRIHFMGVTDDDTLAAAISMVDAVVLPYLEVGQASSGPMSIATEMGARVIASRNQAFMQFDRYNPGRTQFFDVGNHLELSQRIEEALALPRPDTAPEFGTATNREVYRAAHEVLFAEHVDE